MKTTVHCCANCLISQNLCEKNEERVHFRNFNVARECASIFNSLKLICVKFEWQKISCEQSFRNKGYLLPKMSITLPGFMDLGADKRLFPPNGDLMVKSGSVR